MFRKFFVPLLIGVLSGWTIGEACGKGPKGGKGPPAAKSRGNGSPGAKTVGNPTVGNGQKLTGRDNAFSVQRQNEVRKLAQRKGTAQKLRDIAGRNGNDNLLQTADRMDQQALSHYEQRLAKIDELTSKGDVAGLKDLADGATDATDIERARKDALKLADGAPLNELDPSGVVNTEPQSVARRLLNEERKLQHQLDVAQQLRDIAARNGNQNLLQTAERMETMAADRYQSQLARLGGLTDAAGAVESATAPVK
jgi:hypothetical protein